MNDIQFMIYCFPNPQAAGVCRPLVSTVIARGPDQQLTESLDRSRYFNSEMPQAFRAQVISGAYDQVGKSQHTTMVTVLILVHTE